MFELVGHVVLWLFIVSIVLFLIGQSRWGGRVLVVSLLLVVKVVAVMGVIYWLQNHVQTDTDSMWCWLVAILIVIFCAVAYGIWISVRFVLRGARRVVGHQQVRGSLMGAIIGAVIAELIRGRLAHRNNGHRRP